MSHWLCKLNSHTTTDTTDNNTNVEI